jgi:spoIIIJ-associated protein
MDQKILQAIETFLQGLFQIAGETALLRVTESEEGLLIDLQGAQVFVGQNQRALHSLAHLVEIYVKRTLGTDVSVQLDADNYRERRKGRTACAGPPARRRGPCVSTRRSCSTPMEPYERKAVHEALSTLPRVRTYSEGQGGGAPRRHRADPRALIIALPSHRSSTPASA